MLCETQQEEKVVDRPPLLEYHQQQQSVQSYHLDSFSNKMEGLTICKHCNGETLKVNKVCHLCSEEVGERCWRCNYLGKIGSKFCFRCNVKLQFTGRETFSHMPVFASNSLSFDSNYSSTSSESSGSNWFGTTDTEPLRSVKKILEDIERNSQSATSSGSLSNSSNKAFTKRPTNGSPTLMDGIKPKPFSTLKVPPKKSYRKSIGSITTPVSVQSTPAGLSSEQLLGSTQGNGIYEISSNDDSSSDELGSFEDEQVDDLNFMNDLQQTTRISTPNNTTTVTSTTTTTTTNIEDGNSKEIKIEEEIHEEKEINSLKTSSSNPILATSLSPGVPGSISPIKLILPRDKPRLQYTQAKYNLFPSPDSASPNINGSSGPTTHCSIPPPILLIEDITTTTTTTTTTTKSSILSPIIPTPGSTLSSPPSILSPNSTGSCSTSYLNRSGKHKHQVSDSSSIVEIIDAFPSPPTSHSASSSLSNSLSASTAGLHSTLSSNSSTTTANKKSKKSIQNTSTTSLFSNGLPPPPPVPSTSPNLYESDHNISLPMNPKSLASSSTTTTTSSSTTQQLYQTIQPISPNSKQNHRNNLINEIISTEKDYINDLEMIIEVFYKPLTDMITMEESVSIFSNIQEIYKVNSILYDKLQSSFTIGQVFFSLSDSLDVYSVYCNYHQKSLECLNTILKQPHIENFFLELNRKLELRGMGLHSFLIKPIQRICKYPLLLKELLKATPEDHFDYHQLILANEKIERIVNTINNEKKENETWQRTMQIIQSLKGAENLQLLAANRRLISEGSISMVGGLTGGNGGSNNSSINDDTPTKKSQSNTLKFKKGVYFLFNDLFLYTKQKGASYKLLLSIPLDTILIHGNVSNTGDKHFFTLVEFGMAARRWTFYPPSKSQNQNLIQTMQKLIEANWDEKFKTNSHQNINLSTATNSSNNNSSSSSTHGKRKLSRRLVKSLVNIKS